jgi:phosphatidylethanolamine-binding protein (PEBP) family uncharacterized protein
MTAAPARNGATLRVTSPDIKPGLPLDPRFTIAGANRSPALNWSRGPSGTKSYVVFAEEIPQPGWPESFWVVINIPATATGLPQGTPQDMKLARPAGAISVLRDVIGESFHDYVRVDDYESGYQGGAEGHKGPIHFEVFAVDKKLNLGSAILWRASISELIHGHVLASGEIVADLN